MTTRDERKAILRERYLNLLSSKAKRGGHATRLAHRLHQINRAKPEVVGDRDRSPRPVTLPHVKWLDRPDP